MRSRLGSVRGKVSRRWPVSVRHTRQPPYTFLPIPIHFLDSLKRRLAGLKVPATIALSLADVQTSELELASRGHTVGTMAARGGKGRRTKAANSQGKKGQQC